MACRVSRVVLYIIHTLRQNPPVIQKFVVVEVGLLFIMSSGIAGAGAGAGVGGNEGANVLAKRLAVKFDPPTFAMEYVRSQDGASPKANRHSYLHPT